MGNPWQNEKRLRNNIEDALANLGTAGHLLHIAQIQADYVGNKELQEGIKKNLEDALKKLQRAQSITKEQEEALRDLGLI